MAGSVTRDDPAGGIVRLTIAHPGRRGALDHPLLDALAEHLAAVAGEPRTRAVILTGVPGEFSAGYDIGDIPDDVFAVQAEKLVAHPFTAALDALAAIDVATVACLTGPAIGGGLELAVCCDFRVAADGVKLGMPPAKLGLVYSHVGLRRFLDCVGEPRTRELFLLGRYVDAAEAHRWGLVHRVAPPDEAPDVALDLAGELAANAPLSIAGQKRVLREVLAARAALSPELEERLVAERRASFASQDMLEGVKAFGEKRPPRWTGR